MDSLTAQNNFNIAILDYKKWAMSVIKASSGQDVNVVCQRTQDMEK